MVGESVSFVTKGANPIQMYSDMWRSTVLNGTSIGQVLVKASPLILAGLALAVTPTVVFLGGALNPNGVEIAAAIALWCGLLELLSDRQRRPDRRMALRLAVPAVIMAAMRPLSPALLLTIVGFVVIVLAEPSELRERWQSRSLRVATAVVAIGGVLNAPSAT